VPTHLRPMLAAYGWICGIFIGIPALLMSIANPSVAAGILASVASFVLPCLLTGALLCDWAGQGLAQRKWPAFCMAGLSLLAAALAVPLLAALLAPPSGVWSLDAFWVGAAFVLIALFFGAGPAALAAVLFIGGVERANAAAAPEQMIDG
jgi:hypothetical protein